MFSRWLRREARCWRVFSGGSKKYQLIFTISHQSAGVKSNLPIFCFRISNVRLDHGGKYTCGPTTGISDTVMVHIIAGI